MPGYPARPQGAPATSTISAQQWQQGQYPAQAYPSDPGYSGYPAHPGYGYPPHPYGYVPYPPYPGYPGYPAYLLQKPSGTVLFGMNIVTVVGASISQLLGGGHEFLDYPACG